MATWWGWTEEASTHCAYVYMLLCEDTAGAGFLKLGLTQCPDKRLPQLRVGCPLPLKMMAVAQFDCRITARRVEKALHNEFEDRSVTGEWFRFDFRGEADKTAFNIAWKRIFARYDPKAFWTKIKLKEFDKLQSKRAAFARKCGMKRRHIANRLFFNSLNRQPRKTVRFNDSFASPTLAAGDKVPAAA